MKKAILITMIIFLFMAVLIVAVTEFDGRKFYTDGVGIWVEYSPLYTYGKYIDAGIIFFCLGLNIYFIKMLLKENRKTPKKNIPGEAEPSNL